MNNNQRNKAVNKNTWILLIILSLVIIGISFYQIGNGDKGSSVNYLIVLLGIIVIIASTFNIFKKRK